VFFMPVCGKRPAAVIFAFQPHSHTQSTCIVRRRRQIESAKLAAEVKIICTLASRAIVDHSSEKVRTHFCFVSDCVIFFYHSSLGGALNLIRCGAALTSWVRNLTP
jgi:hypothetical protein